MKLTRYPEHLGSQVLKDGLPFGALPLRVVEEIVQADLKHGSHSTLLGGARDLCRGPAHQAEHHADGGQGCPLHGEEHRAWIDAPQRAICANACGKPDERHLKAITARQLQRLLGGIIPGRWPHWYRPWHERRPE